MQEAGRGDEQQQQQEEDSAEEFPRMAVLERCLDSPVDDEEASRVRGLPPPQVEELKEAFGKTKAEGNAGLPALLILQLTFQSLGVVYGDLSTSPLYVYPTTFPDGIHHEEELLGVLSLIIYTLTLIPLIKYTLIVMKANDNGEGGTFALYSLICRHVEVNTIANQHRSDCNLTTYSSKKPDEKSLAGKTKKWLEGNGYSQKLLLILVLLGTSMLIGDGILTPAISVLSSVSGITDKNKDLVVSISIAILVGLFSLQKFGTDKVAWIFAPIVFLWLLVIGYLGVYNIFKHNRSVFRAFSPHYIIRYFSMTKRKGWQSLGGIVLCITGAEAMFADIGHFSTLPIQIAFTAIVFPCLIASYMGQASYLMQFPDDVEGAFYNSTPDSVYWLVFILATLAAIIASQSIITATFSVVKQALALGYFPRVKVIHTSQKFAGQIYIPEINWILMILCVSLTAGFRDTTKIGNAYGIAVVTVMLVTTIFMSIVMLLIWRSNVLFVGAFAMIFLTFELGYFSSALSILGEGGWAPLAIASIFLLVMYSWHYGTLKKYQFEMQNKVSIGWILGLGPSLGLVRIPGIGLVYTELAHGVPSIFSHFVTHIPAMHAILIFVCVKYLPVNTVPEDERFLFKRIGPKEYSMYRCVVRYGYKDLHRKDDKFEQNLIGRLTELIKLNAFSEASSSRIGIEDATFRQGRRSSSSPQIVFVEEDNHDSSIASSIISSDEEPSPRTLASAQIEADLHHLEMAKQAGVVHIMGDTILKARKGSHILKRFIINYVYALLRRLCWESSAALHVPHEGLFSLGQVYYV